MFYRAEMKAPPKLAMRPVRLAAKLALLCASAAIISPLAHAAELAADLAVNPAANPVATDDVHSDTLMPSVTVTGTTDRVSTENSGSFGTRKATIFKGLESLREIPQPVTVLTRQFIEDRALLNLTDLLLATPGIAVDYTDSERVTYHSRGYQIDAMQVDGLTITQGGSAFAQPDAAVLDRVEILRGASGMLRGSGNPSATVNMVRKRPTRDFQASATAVLGSWERRRAEGDISGALNDAGTVRARLVAVKDKKESFQNAMKEDRQVIYGVVEADLSPNTLLTASLQRTELDATGSWGGIPANFDGSPLNLPRDTFLGASWNRWNRANEQAFVELEQRFDNGWTAKASAGYLHLKMDPDGFKQSYIARSSTTNPYLFGVTTSQYTGDDSQQDNFAFNANGPFSLLGRQHKLVVGAETLRTRTVATAGLGNQFPLTNVDIRNWDPYSTYPERNLVTVNNLKPTFTQQQGVFATTSLSLMDSLTALAGVRLSWWEYRAPAAPATSYKVERQTTPFAGLVYDITRNINAYASYTEIFTPQNVKDINNNMLKPITGEDYEAGFKGEFMGGKLNASAGVFRITNNGRAVQDTSSINPCPPSNLTGFCSIAGGKTQSEGWEAELSGEVATGWSVMGGYTNTRTKYVIDSTAANVGAPLRAIDPRHQLRIFSNYRLSGMLKGWTVGGGANIQSDATVTGSGLAARQGGYSVLNAMAGYRFNDRYSVQVNVNNLTDKYYYKKFAPTGLSYYYGDPRNVVVTLRAAL
jgi:outer membrane receptor for ferric coprogen and ferric-rhodotorulic acid